jgi:hypothetical protein
MLQSRAASPRLRAHRGDTRNWMSSRALKQPKSASVWQYLQESVSTEWSKIRGSAIVVGMISALCLLGGVAPSAHAIPIGNDISACVPGTCPTGAAAYPTVGVCAAPAFRDNG